MFRILKYLSKIGEKNYKVFKFQLNVPCAPMPDQWPSDSSIKTGRGQVPGSISGRACLPSRSEFSVFFSETHVNME